MTYKETLEEWIDTLWDAETSEKKALKVRLQLLLYKEKTRWFELPKGGRVGSSVRRSNPSQRGTR
jgi:hypothetical protein